MNKQRQGRLVELSPILLLFLGILMTVRLGFYATETVYLGFNLQWFIPVLAAWIGRHCGARALFAWWPLALLPIMSVRLGPASVGLGLSATTLLIAVFVALIADRSIERTALLHCVRSDWKRMLQLSFCLLVIGGLEYGSIYSKYWSFTLLAIPAALAFLAVIKWKSLFLKWDLPLFYGSAQLQVAIAVIVAAVLVGGMVVHAKINLDDVRLSIGSTWIGTLIPVLCFVLVAFNYARIRTILLLLVVALVVDRLVTYGAGSLSDLLRLKSEWRRLNWDVLFSGFSAALVAVQIMPYLGTGKFEPVRPFTLAVNLGKILVVLFLGYPLVTWFQPTADNPTLWILGVISFIAGVNWQGRGLLFAPLIMLFFYLLAAISAPLGEPRSDDMVAIGIVSFAFAFCGVLSNMDRLVFPVKRATHSVPTHSGIHVTTVDISPLARVIEMVDRSTTWRSFFVSAAPFIVLWQLVIICLAYGFAIGAFPFFDRILDSGLEWWFIAGGVVLSIAPFGFVLWDWLDRQNSLRLLAVASGSGLGAIIMIVLGNALGQLGYITHEIQGEFLEIFLLSSLVAFLLIFLCSGLLARSSGACLIVFRVLGGIIVTAVLACLVMLGIDDEFKIKTILQLSAMLAAAVLLVIFLIRFVSLRLILASDVPRELLFGELREKKFWVRMAAVSGLPSSCWQRSSLKKPEFWALFSARLIVYVGLGVARTWAFIGLLLTAFGHLAFYSGKRLSAKEIWRPKSCRSNEHHILFLRGFDDDQCEFKRPPWNLFSRWLDLWAFRRNVDEAMVDEIFQFGAVVALGRPGDKRVPFGALRHYSADEDWQNTLAEAARSARAIILVASDSPGVQWEYDLLKREQMIQKVLLLFRPEPTALASNRRACEWYCDGSGDLLDDIVGAGQAPVAMYLSTDGPLLMTASKADAAAYVLALRMHFLGSSADVESVLNAPILQ